MTRQTNDNLMGTHCRECYSINHSTNQCPHMEPEGYHG